MARSRHDRRTKLSCNSPVAAELLERRELLSVVPTFALWEYAVVGDGPRDIVAADFNGDGKTDLATANLSSTASVSVLLNAGNGKFPTTVDYAPTAAAARLEAADLNADGKVDLAVLNLSSGELSIMLNAGDGTFGTSANYDTGADPSSLAVADFNNDGLIDLAVARHSGQLGVMLNLGGGILAPKIDYSIPVALACSVTTGDFNRDGKTDLAVTGRGTDLPVNLSVLLNAGNGTFASAVGYSVGTDSTGIAADDLNGDGWTDLVTGDGSAGMNVLLNNKDGTFGPSVSYTTILSTYSVVTGDFNSDGIKEVALPWYNNASVFQGIGDGTFNDRHNHRTTFTLGLAIAAADFNGDGRLDMAVTGYTQFDDHHLNVLINTTGKPSNIAISNANLSENQPAGSIVGAFTTTDPDPADTFVYSLVSGTGDGDNALFAIQGSDLVAAGPLDFETRSSYSVRVRSTDLVGLSVEKAFTVTITDANEAPVIQDQLLGPIAEDSTEGQAVGTVVACDPDAGQRLFYSIIAGNTGNAFSIHPTTGLITVAGPLNYETAPRFNLTVCVTDNGDAALSSSAVVTVKVGDVNEPPTDISLYSYNIYEGQEAGTLVGYISHSDPDLWEYPLVKYSLVDGYGDDALFCIGPNENQLLTAVVLDHETQGTCHIKLRATDGNGLYLEETFTIEVLDVEPVVSLPARQAMLEDGALVFSAANNNAIAVTKGDPGNLLQYVSLEVEYADGTLSLGSTDGLLSLSGDGTNKITFVSTVENANAAMDGLAFLPKQDYNGSARIRVDVSGMREGGGTMMNPNATVQLNLDFSDFFNGYGTLTHIYQADIPGAVGIDITAVNDAPSFTMGNTALTVAEDCQQSFPNWAADISKGNVYEYGQHLQFVVTTDNPSLFNGTPEISSGGTLNLDLRQEASGTATVTVILKDDGGTSNGGVDQSSPQSFTITVTPVNDTPVPIRKTAFVGDDATAMIQLSARDPDSPADGLRYQISQQPAHGALTDLGGGLFRYEVARGYDGGDSFTFTATDSEGATGSPAVVSISGGVMRTLDSNGMLQFYTSNLSLALIHVKRGAGSVFFGNSGCCEIGRIFIDNTVADSSLKISTRNNGVVQVLGGIDCSGPLRRISAPTAVISGVIKIGGGGDCSLSMWRGAGASVISDSGIKSISADAWFRSGDASAVIKAPSLRKLNIRGDFAGDLDVGYFGGGRIGGSMIASQVEVAGSTGKLSILGDMTAVRWNVGGDIGKLTVAGTADHSSLRSVGSISAVSVGASFESDFLAGIGPIVARTPQSHDDFANLNASVRSFTVKGLKGHVAEERFFSGSNISASLLGKIKLLNGDFSSGGIYASSGIKSIRHTDKADPSNNWVYPPRSGIVFAQPDLIHVL